MAGSGMAAAAAATASAAVDDQTAKAQPQQLVDG